MNPTVLPYTKDDALLDAVRLGNGGALDIYTPVQRSVVLGRGSRIERELNLAVCVADRVPVFRRRGGGCAVVLDRGNVVVSVALVADGLGHTATILSRLSSWVVSGLERCGIKGVCREASCDLSAAGKKVGGGCLYCSRDLTLYSTTLLVSPDVAAMMRYLSHPPREPGYRAGRAHLDFVGRLEWRGDAEALAVALRRVLSWQAAATAIKAG